MAVRSFFLSEVSRKEREQALEVLIKAAGAKASADTLVKIALRPLMKTGKKHEVIDEAILVKEAVEKLAPPIAFATLRSLLE